MTTCTVAPACVIRRASSTTLYAAMEPVTASTTNFPRNRSGFTGRPPPGRLAGSVIELPEETQALEGEVVVDAFDARGERHDRRDETARPDDPRRRWRKLGDEPGDEPFDQADVAEHDPRADAVGGVLADRVLWGGEGDREEPRGAAEERFGRDLEPGRERAAEEIALGAHDVEVRRRPEVDDDRRPAVATVGGERVRDTVRADLGRVVDPEADPGLHAGPDDEGPTLHVPIGEADEGLRQRRHDAAEDERIDRLEREVLLTQERVDRDGELILGPRAIGRRAPGRDELRPAVHADDDVRVAGVDREERRHSDRLVRGLGRAGAQPALAPLGQGASDVRRDQGVDRGAERRELLHP